MNENEIKEALERYKTVLKEISCGTEKDPACLVQTIQEEYDGIVVLRKIRFYSICEHDLLPFFGHVHVCYIPKDKKICSFGSFGRTIDALTKRPQLQERLTRQLIETVKQVLNPKGALVVVEAEHLCLSMRGAHSHGISCVTMKASGVIESDETLRRDALALLGITRI